MFFKTSKNIQFFNSTSTKLPFMNNSVDRVLALESAQHFKPLENFIVDLKEFNSVWISCNGCTHYC